MAVFFKTDNYILLLIIRKLIPVSYVYKCESCNIYWIYDNIEDDHVSDNDDTSYFTKTYKKIRDTDEE